MSKVVARSFQVPAGDANTHKNVLWKRKFQKSGPINVPGHLNWSMVEYITQKFTSLQMGLKLKFYYEIIYMFVNQIFIWGYVF